VTAFESPVLEGAFACWRTFGRIPNSVDRNSQLSFT